MTLQPAPLSDESLPAAADPISRKLKLRTLLTLPFVGLVCVPAIIIAGSSLYAGLKAVDVLSQQLIEVISSRVEQAAVHQLEEAAITLQSAFPSQANSFDGSIDTFRDPAKIERKLFELTAHTRTTSYLFFGGKDGSFVGVDRGRAGRLAAATVRLQPVPGEPRTIYSASVPLDRSRLIETETRIYDARSRPWYRAAEAERKLNWTPVYVSFATGALVTTASQPILTREGSFHGVLAADVELDELSQFIKSINVSAKGVAFIVDDKGFLVATSTAESPFRLNGSEQHRVLATSSESDLVRVSANWLAQQANTRPLGRLSDNAVRLATLESTLGATDVASRDISGIDGVSWRVVVAVPRSDFTAAIVSSAIVTFFVTLAALGCSLLLGLWVLRRVTSDVEKLEIATRLGADGSLPRQMPEMRLLETGRLAAAFSVMVAKVQKSLDTIRLQNEELSGLNSELEQRVVHRTHALNERNDLLSREVALRQSVEESLREASERSIKAADDKAKFLAMLSHELRTPLQAIIGSSQLLSDRLPHGPSELVTLEASAKSMFALVDGILSYSRLEAGRVSLKPSRFKTADLVAEAIDVVSAALAEPLSTFEISIAPSVPRAIYADAGMIRQLLINLLHNAHKHGAGKPVELSVVASDGQPLDESGQTAAAHSRWIRFAVRDRGAGISEAEQPTLFQPFSQIGVAGADPSRGSGLGLAICRMLATELGGTIQLQSTMGVGSTFSVTLPIPPENELPEETTSPSFWPTTAPLPSLRILLVEDHEINRMLVTQLLQSLNQTVVAVASGESAVDSLSKDTFDLALLDINLPGISGLEVARIVSARAAERAAPHLCALTANDQSDVRALASAAGMAFFLPKPVTLRALETLLRSVSERINVAGEVAPAPTDVASTLEEVALLDAGFLEMLKHAEQKSAAPFVSRLLTQYSEGATGEYDALKKLWAGGKRAGAIAAAHSMRGAAKSVGAAALATALKRFESEPTDESINSVGGILTQSISALAAWAALNLG